VIETSSILCKSSEFYVLETSTVLIVIIL
jgi:hypothetical protein